MTTHNDRMADQDYDRKLAAADEARDAATLRTILEVSQSRYTLHARLVGRTREEVDRFKEQELAANTGLHPAQLSLPVWREVRANERPAIGYAWLELKDGVLVQGAANWDSGD